MAGRVGSASFGILLVDGYDLLATKPKSSTFKIEALQEASHGLGDAWEGMTPTGVKKVSIAQEGGFFDDTANRAHTMLDTAAEQRTSRVMVLAYAGNTIGSPMLGTEGVYGQTYEVLARVGELTKANVGYAVSGQVDLGVLLQEHEAKTADWNTKTTDSASVDYTADRSQRVVPITSNSKANPTVVTTTVAHGLTSGDKVLIAGVATSSPTINGSRTVTVISTTTFSVPVDTSAGAAGTGGTLVRVDSAGGGVGYLAVSACSGFSNFVGKIQHSTDDTTYVDLISFTDNVTAPFTERKTVAGTVNRYLCFDGNVTGSGSITLCCGFART